MTDVWIVLVEDRHANVEALPFSSEAAALEAARHEARWCAGDPPRFREGKLTPGMIRDGWVLYLPYGPEGDFVRVVKREMDRSEQS